MLREHAARRHVALILFTVTFVALATGYLVRGRRVAHASPDPRAAEMEGWSSAAGDPAMSDKMGGPAGVRLPASALERIALSGEGYVAELDNGARAELTLDPRLQRLADHMLAQYDAPLAAAVMLSIDDGRVLAMAGRSAASPEHDSRELALQAWAPAASVFKVVTAAALLEEGVTANARVCYHGGVHALDASNLVAHPRLDRDCNTLAFGVAKSQNAILARLAHDRLDAPTLERAARALGFGSPLPFELPIGASTATIPTDPLDFARVAAGFWQTTLSPMHGAFLAATIAREGTTPPLHLVDRIVSGEGSRIPLRPESRPVLDAAVARSVGEMMIGTTDYGTARSSFRDRRGRHFLPGVSVAGKTGSLNGWETLTPDLQLTARPTHDDAGADGGRPLAYSWFVGYAPAEKPEVAVAVLLGNAQAWKPRAHQIARQLLEGYFHGGAGKQLVAAR